jgi:DNA-binding transcriptional LysR family regulator
MKTYDDPVQPLDSMNLSALRIFAAVYECQSFSAAARQLQLAPSTVSKHIDALERGLDNVLILRSTRKLRVTEAGLLFYEHCKAALERMDEATHILTAAKSELAGNLRIVAPPAFTRCVLTPHLAAFMHLYPRVSVEVCVSSTEIDLVQEGIDLAFVMDNQHAHKTPLIFVAPSNSRICASPAYIKKYGMPKIPDEVSMHRCLSGVGSQYHEHWPFLIGKDIKRVQVNPVLKSNVGDMLRTCCLAGLGLAGLYGFHVHEDIAQGRLVEVLEDYRPDIGAIYASVPHRRITSPNARAFLAFLRQHFPG